MTDYQTIKYEVREHVASLTLNRPEVLNAISGQMKDELRDAWSIARLDDEVRAIIITGEGEKAFCVGADRLSDEATQKRDGVLRNPDVVPGSPGYESDLDLVAPKTNLCYKPVIAAVNGMACGGAFYLLGESDIIVAADHATFFDPHVTFGMVSSYESILMLQKMPVGELIRMQLLGSYERLSAKRALEIGLVSEVTTASALNETAEWIASAIAAQPPGAIQGTLRAIWGAQSMVPQVALAHAPHFIAMSDPKVWRDGKEEFASGKRVKPRIR